MWSERLCGLIEYMVRQNVQEDNRLGTLVSHLRTEVIYVWLLYLGSLSIYGSWSGYSKL